MGTPLTTMLKNYFLVAYRTLLRHKGYTLLNIWGLTLGLSCGVLVFLLIKFHLSFDQYHSKIDRTYQITTQTKGDGINDDPGVPFPLAQALRQDFSFFDDVALVSGVYNALIAVLGAEGKKKFNEAQSLCFTEPSYFNILDYQWLAGQPKTALQKPNTVVLTRKVAEKYFGSVSEAFGKVIRMNNDLDLSVTGILENIPDNTDRRQELFVSLSTLKNNPGYARSGLDNWSGFSSSTTCLLTLKAGVSPQRLERALPAFIKKYHTTEAAHWNHPVVPFATIHFSEKYGRGLTSTHLWALGLVGLFLVGTACINFVNLATAQALKRSKEVGVRKVIGGTKLQLFGQFMAETAVITCCSLLLAALVAELSLPVLNQWATNAGMPFPLFTHTNPLADGQLWLFLLGIGLVVVLLSGSYPGIVLAGFKPVQALKGQVSSQQVGGMSIRRSLVVVQFVITQILLISTLVVMQQMRFFQRTSLGFTTSALSMINIPEQTHVPTFRNRLAQLPGIEAISFCSSPPASTTNSNNNHRFDQRQEEESWSANTKPADSHYLETFGLTLVAGQNFPKADTASGYLVNETYVRRLGLKPDDVVGKSLEVWGRTAPIYGVVKDWYNRAARSEIQPVILFPRTNSYAACGLKINPRTVTETRRSVEQLWEETFPDYLYQPYELDEQLTRFYIAEDMILACIQFFAGIAIFIGCLGLYGLVSFMTAHKTKEIGVRKVLGASIPQILTLFGIEFSRLIIVAFLVAAPVGWWAMSQWLNGYTYKIQLGWGIYALSLVVTTGIVLMSVGYQSFRAATANPIKSLKSE